MMHQKTNWGYVISVVGVATILILVGIYKFTPKEAELIAPFVQNHPLMSWMYNILSKQQVSNLVGIMETAVGFGLLIGFKKPVVGFISGIGASVIFIITFSFMFTTPDIFKIADKIPTTNFFLIKDLIFLTVSLMVVEANKHVFYDCMKSKSVLK